MKKLIKIFLTILPALYLNNAMGDNDIVVILKGQITGPDTPKITLQNDNCKIDSDKGLITQTTLDQNDYSKIETKKTIYDSSLRNERNGAVGDKRQKSMSPKVPTKRKSSLFPKRAFSIQINLNPADHRRTVPTQPSQDLLRPVQGTTSHLPPHRPPTQRRYRWHGQTYPYQDQAP